MGQIQITGPMMFLKSFCLCLARSAKGDEVCCASRHLLLNRRSRWRAPLYALVLSTGLFVCLSVCLSVAKMRTETRFSQKTKQSKAMVSIDDLHRLFKVTRYWIPKIQDGGRSQIVFGHSSAADSPISVKFCAAKHIFTEFR